MVFWLVVIVGRSLRSRWNWPVLDTRVLGCEGGVSRPGECGPAFTVFAVENIADLQGVAPAFSLKTQENTCKSVLAVKCVDNWLDNARLQCSHFPFGIQNGGMVEVADCLGHERI